MEWLTATRAADYAVAPVAVAAAHKITEIFRCGQRLTMVESHRAGVGNEAPTAVAVTRHYVCEHEVDRNEEPHHPERVGLLEDRGAVAVHAQEAVDAPTGRDTSAYHLPERAHGEDRPCET